MGLVQILMSLSGPVCALADPGWICADPNGSMAGTSGSMSVDLHGLDFLLHIHVGFACGLGAR